jgi:PAS domain S-box-containing protein
MSALDLTVAEINSLTAEGWERSDSDRHPASVWIFDTDTLAFLAVNEAAVHAFGYSRKQFLSMTILDVCPIQDIVPLLRSELCQAKHSSMFERQRYLKQGGRLMDVEATSREVSFNGHSAKIVTISDRHHRH